MKLRAMRRRPRGMMVARGYGWGWVVYACKRAYWGLQHVPLDEEGIEKTRMAAATWKTKTAAEIVADIRRAYEVDDWTGGTWI